MNPNRLLQIQQAANPSLRAAATPASLLQGGGITPQYAGVNPQGNTFNPQSNQINTQQNWSTGVPTLNPQVQVAHPGPLYVGNPMNPATSVINQGSGTAGAVGFTPTSNTAQSVIGGIGTLGKSLLSMPAYFLNTDIVNPTRELYNQFTGNKLGYQNAVQQSNEELGLGPNGRNLAGGARKFVGNSAQLATFGAGGLVGKAGGAVATKVGGGLLGTVAKGATEGALLGGPYNVASEVAGNQKLTPSSVGKSFAVGAGTGGALGGLGGLVGAGVSRIKNGPLANQATQVGIDKDTLDYLQSEKNVDAIHNVLKTIYGDTQQVADAAKNIAGSENGRFIIKELGALPEQAAGAAVTGDLAGQYKVDEELAQEAERQREQKQQQNGPTSGTTDPSVPTAQFTPAEAQVLKEAGVPSPAESPASAPPVPKVPLTAEQQQLIQEFPNGADKSVITGLKKQGFTDDVIAKMTQPINDAHEAAGTTPAQAVEKATAKNTAAPTEPIAKAETQKVTKETTGKLASEAPISDIPGASKTEGKLQSKRIAEARLKGDALQTTGQELRSDIHAHETNHRVQLQQVWDHIKPYTDLNKADRSLAREVVAGRATTDDPAIQLAADRVQQALHATRQQGLEAGLDIGDRGPNYLPEELPDLKRKSNFNAAIKHLVDSGQATDAEAAVKKLTQFQSDNSLTQNKFAHYQQRTADIPGKASDQALMDYFRKGTETNSLAKTFGPKGQVFDAHVANAARRGEDAGALKGIIGDYLHPRQAEGLGAGTTKTLQKVLRPLQLKSAAISHLPQQFVNTASSAGFKDWAKGVDKGILDGDMKQFLHEAGLNAEDFGRHGDVADKATAPFLGPVLAKWREFSGASGRIVAQGLAKKGDVAGLKQMLVSGPLKTAEDGSIQLTREQEMQAAHYQADKDIGSHSNIQSTSWAKTTAGRAWGNYLQAYVFKQSERIGDMVREARAGNVAPLVRYLAIGAPTGGAAITIGKEEYKQPGVNPLADPGKLLEGTIKNSGIGTIGYGLGNKLYDAATHNYSGDARWQSAANLAGGSIAGTAVETGQNIAKASHGKTQPLVKEGIGLIPVPGTGYLANKFAPSPQTPYNTPNFQPKTVADLKAVNAKINKDFASSLSPSDKKNFTDNKGNFIDPGTAADAHKQGILNDDQYNHYLALSKVRDREQGKTNYSYYNPSLDAAHASGKIDDTQYNLVKAYDQHQQQQSANLTDQGKRAVASRTPDPEAQKINQNIADYINTHGLPPGLSKLQADPDLAKSFANFVKATATNAAKAPEDQETAIDYQDRTIKFWAQAAKDGAPSNVQSVYRDGGNKAAMFVKQGKATPSDVSQAVGLDNMLLASGIITTPKFSEKWRSANGFPSSKNFMEGGANYGTAGVGQYLSNGNNSVVSTKGGSGGGGGGFGNGKTMDLGNGMFGSVNKKTGAVSLKAVPSLNGSGTTSGVVDPDTGLFISKPTGIKQLLNTKDTTFKSPGMNLPTFGRPQAAPKLKSFAAPDVRGTPRPQRAVPIRFQRAKFN